MPPKNDHWTSDRLKPLSHFFNCHGAAGEPYWYGQRGNRFPKANVLPHYFSGITSGSEKYRRGCRMLVSGADLYRPAVDKLPHSMQFHLQCVFLKSGAIALVGSTTIAYGPSTINDQADLITQYFMMNILGGASTGRALLEARQKYILNHGPDLSPTDLKTISQFNLLGDPSLQIVTGKTDQLKKSTGVKGAPLYADVSRKERRKYLLSKGIALESFVNKLLPAKKLNAGKKARTQKNKLLEENNLAGSDGKTFIVRQNAVNKKTFRATDMLSTKYHIFLEKEKPSLLQAKTTEHKGIEAARLSMLNSMNENKQEMDDDFSRLIIPALLIDLQRS